MPPSHSADRVALSAWLRRCRVAVLVLAGAAACQPESGDAERYVAALAGGLPYSQAMDRCGGIEDFHTRQDCLLAVMEAHQRLEAQDCERLAPGLWQDECRFLLAERLWEGGARERAVDACRGIRFGRACLYHLVWKAAEEATDDPPEAARAHLAPFRGSRIAPDAPEVFWRDWFGRQLSAGHPLDPDPCRALQEPRPCVRGAVERFLRVLQAHHEARGASFCRELAQDPASALPLKPNLPVFVSRPPLVRALDRWRGEHCSNEEGAKGEGG